MNRSRGWTEAAPGFFRLCTAEVNCYLVRKDDGLTLFDAGLPRTRGVLRSALAKLGARMTDIQAVVLTHGHFDHVDSPAASIATAPGYSSMPTTRTWRGTPTATVRRPLACPTSCPTHMGYR